MRSDNIYVDYSLQYSIDNIEMDGMDTYMKEELKDAFFSLYDDDEILSIDSEKIRISFISTSTGVDIFIEFMNEYADDIVHMPFDTYISEINTQEILFTVYGKIQAVDIEAMYQEISDVGATRVKIVGSYTGPLDGTQELRELSFSSLDYPYIEYLEIENITIINSDSLSVNYIFDMYTTKLVLNNVYIAAYNTNITAAINLNIGLDYTSLDGLTSFDNVNFFGDYATAIYAEGVIGDLIITNIYSFDLTGSALYLKNMV